MIAHLTINCVEQAHARAAASLLVMATTDAREAKLIATLMNGDLWTPEFTADVQRRIDQAYRVIGDVASGRWTIEAAKLKQYHEKLVRAGLTPIPGIVK